ncbi:MAG: hypothetical protein Q4E59_00695 [Bacteroidales bacterium]|nr:hypothetical protein [Bacteroidales bacterium]
MRVTTSSGAAPEKLLTCISPVRNKWRARWNVATDEEGVTTWQEADYDHQPTLKELIATVSAWQNAQTDAAILEGMTWEGFKVWLSAANQMNYKAAYDLAVQTDGENLPVSIKVGEDDDWGYVQFDTVDELGAFWKACQKHITDCVSAGWAAKDNIDWSQYDVAKEEETT